MKRLGVLFVDVVGLVVASCVVEDRCGVRAATLACGADAVGRCPNDIFDDVEEPQCFECEPGVCVMNAEADALCTSMENEAFNAAGTCGINLDPDGTGAALPFFPHPSLGCDHVVAVDVAAANRCISEYQNLWQFGCGSADAFEAVEGCEEALLVVHLEPLSNFTRAPSAAP